VELSSLGRIGGNLVMLGAYVEPVNAEVTSRELVQGTTVNEDDPEAPREEEPAVKAILCRQPFIILILILILVVLTVSVGCLSNYSMGKTKHQVLYPRRRFPQAPSPLLSRRPVLRHPPTFCIPDLPQRGATGPQHRSTDPRTQLASAHGRPVDDRRG
jgi:hypothetical protein